ncbi:MAG TPA: alkaline phosphatase D family protein [Steroidobacteraceae bacterium]|nr:alkaline phosphatase D family protein [Steroidobacteraceae bacterium]
MPRLNRRTLLSSGLLLAGASALGPWPRRVLAQPRLTRDPFTLGVASGYPTPDGFVLWTRLAPEPLAPDGGMPPAVMPVTWEIASDEQFRTIVRSGTAYAEPDWAHSVHLDVEHLEPAREYWYRFTAGEARSPVGHTWTAPRDSGHLERLRFNLASCQQYEHGYYTAYRQMLADHPDLIVHVGDYIYELSWGTEHVRSHGAGECYTLSDYRVRHALYRSDPDLQAAHAICPWLLMWDDHEVDNDYAGAVSEEDDDPTLFLARRAAAYRAYYEHLPLPRRAVPFGADMRLYASCRYADLLTVHLLDERQYRAAHACPPEGRAGSTRVSPEDCAALLDEKRTMLGERQENWLTGRLRASKTTWNFLGQGVVMAYENEDKAPAQRFWTDSWNGYPAARARLMRQLHDTKVANPIVLSGDIHAFVVSDLHLDPANPDTPRVASELVATSITSQPTPKSVLGRYQEYNPATLLATGEARGYVRIDVTRSDMRADLIAMETVRERTSPSRTLASFAAEAGRPGLMGRSK